MKNQPLLILLASVIAPLSVSRGYLAPIHCLCGE